MQELNIQEVEIVSGAGCFICGIVNSITTTVRHTIYSIQSFWTDPSDADATAIAVVPGAVAVASGSGKTFVKTFGILIK